MSKLPIPALITVVGSPSATAAAFEVGGVGITWTTLARPMRIVPTAPNGTNRANRMSMMPNNTPPSPLILVVESTIHPMKKFLSGASPILAGVVVDEHVEHRTDQRTPLLGRAADDQSPRRA